MRLISIGRSASSTICIKDEHVSSNHAQLLLLDNGEVLLTDCGSMHGTYVNGHKIQAYAEVPVKRGDKIDFYTYTLNWSDVPQIKLPDPSIVKGIYGVGKASRNKYKLVGNNVSRYHATFKEMKNGKWYLIDHSTNGTMVNGQKIPSNIDYQIKAKDTIVCGGVTCPNPIPPIPFRKMAAIFAGVVAVVIIAIIGGIYIPEYISTTKFDPKKTVALITANCNIKVVFDNDILSPGECFYLSEDGGLTDNQEEALIVPSSGTAFFVSENGLMLTNRHVVDAIYADLTYSDGEEMDQLSEMVEEAREEAIYRAKYYQIYDQSYSLWEKSSFKFEVVVNKIAIRYPERTYSSVAEFDFAHLVDKSETDDIALIRLNSGTTPQLAHYFKLKRSVLDISNLRESETYFTTGFPDAETVATAFSSNYQSTTLRLHLAQAPQKRNLFFVGDQSVGGCSGSPIYDGRKRLVGILWGGRNVINSTTACPVNLAIDFVNEAIEEDKVINEYRSKN